VIAVRRSSEPEAARARAELGSKCPIEVGDIAEAAVQGDVYHLSGFRRQSPRGFTQAGSQHVLVRRTSGQPFERPQEMIRAQPRAPCKRVERQTSVQVTLDPSYRARDASFRIQWQVANSAGRPRGKLHRADREYQSQLAPRHLR